MIQIRDERFPLVELEVREQFGAEDCMRFKDTLDRFFTEERRFGLAAHVVDLSMPEVAVLKEVSSWMSARESCFRTYMVAFGMTMTSAVVRGALAFVHRLAPPPYAQKVFTVREETEAWVMGRLRDAGLVESSAR